MLDLVEDFSSLSLGSIPGSMAPGLDPKDLPRPLEGDVDPAAFSDLFPVNRGSRYLGLSLCHFHTQWKKLALQHVFSA